VATDVCGDRAHTQHIGLALQIYNNLFRYFLAVTWSVDLVISNYHALYLFITVRDCWALFVVARANCLVPSCKHPSCKCRGR
jgi:hypothetical protein